MDDDTVFRGLARRMIVAAGLEVVAEASTVAAALAVAGRIRPAAALVDVGLPDGDGVALARELAALPWRPRVVLTSTDADAATPDDVRPSGAGPDQGDRMALDPQTLSTLEPAQFVALVKGMSDQEIRDDLAGPHRKGVLDSVFSRFPQSFRADKAGGRSARIDFRVTGGPGDSSDTVD